MKTLKRWTTAVALTTSTAATLVSGIGTSSAATSNSPQTLSWFSDVTWWTVPPWTMNTSTIAGKIYNEITQKTGLEFDFTVPPQDPDTKLNLMMVSGKLPDLITLTNGTTEAQLVKSGKVWNLTDFFKKYDPAFLKSFPKDLIGLENQNLGGFYSIPDYPATPDLLKEYPPSSSYFLKTSQYQDNRAIVVNQHILKQAGLTMKQLQTEGGLLAALKKVQNMHLTYKGAPVIPFQIDNSWMWANVDGLAEMFGAMPVDKQGNYRDLILAPETKHAIDWLFHAAQAGVLGQGEFSLDTSGIKAAVESGRTFVFMGNTPNANMNQMWQTDPTETWKSIGPLLSKQGYRPTFGHANEGSGWEQLFISKSAQDPAAIAKFVAFMSSPAGVELGTYGLNGRDYKFNNKGLLVLTPTYQKDTANNAWATTGVSMWWPFVNPYLQDHIIAAPTDKSTLMSTAYMTAWGSSPKSYKYDSSAFNMPGSLIPAGSKLANDQTQINQYEQTEVAKMIFAKDQATENAIYTQMISKLHAMGLDQIDNVINQQFHKQEKALGEHIKGINP